MRMQTKALLLKDWLVLSRQMKVFLVLIAVFSLSLIHISEPTRH